MERKMQTRKHMCSSVHGRKTSFNFLASVETLYHAVRRVYTVPVEIFRVQINFIFAVVYVFLNFMSFMLSFNFELISFILIFAVFTWRF